MRKRRGTPTVGGKATTACVEVTQLGWEGASATAAGGGEAGRGATTEKKERVLACTELGEQRKGQEVKAGGGACTVADLEQETEIGWGGAGGSAISGGGSAMVRRREKSANAMACRCRKAVSSTEVTLRSGVPPR